MVTETLTLRAINRATLARQMLLAREPVSTVDAIEPLCGLQAQEPKPPFTALWSRLAGFERDELRSALQAREVVRATLMRGDAASDERPRLRGISRAAAARPRPGDAHARRPRRGPRRRRRCCRSPEALLQAEPRTFNELRALLVAEFPEVNERALGYAVRMQLPLVMVPTDDPLGFPSVAASRSRSRGSGRRSPPRGARKRCCAATSPRSARRPRPTCRRGRGSRASPR